MGTWLEAATFCEEIYGIVLNTKEGFFICPNCGEPIYERDWENHNDWYECPICAESFGAAEILED